MLTVINENGIIRTSYPTKGSSVVTKKKGSEARAMSLKIVLVDGDGDWKETLKSGDLDSFFSCEMYMTVDNGSEQLTINTATLYGTALISMTDGIINMLTNKDKQTFHILGFGSVHDYYFHMKGPEIKIEAVNVTNDQVELFLFYDKLAFAHDLVKTLKNHLQEIAHINPRIKEQKRYHLLEHGVSVLNSILERY